MHNQFHRQSGGTLLGLIIGLIIGLGIAVAVAFTITKTPLPFTNKQGKAERRVDSATGEPNDPNKPLYGNKAASREAAKDLARQPEEQAAGDTATSQVKSESRAPVVDNSTAVARAQKSDEAEEKFIYYLQAGAFLSQPDAENTKGKLALLGVAATISERRSDSGILYRVRIGPFSDQVTMNRMRGKLSESGMDVATIRVPK